MFLKNLEVFLMDFLLKVHGDVSMILSSAALES